MALLLTPLSGEGPAYRRLAAALRLLITDGRVLPGTRFPSERDLTAGLAVSRTTVTRAYDELRRRGYLVSQRGSGSVAALPGGQRPAGGPNLLDPGPADESWIDLSCAAPAATAGTAAAYTAALDELPRLLAGPGYHPAGLPALREVLATRFTAQGLPTDPGQILVTSGALAALAVVARAYLGTGDRVLVESPTYPNAVATLRRAGARLVGVPCPPSGLDPHTVALVAGQSRPRLAVLIPDHHNPTGTSMSDQDRSEVAAGLAAQGVLPVIDETLREVILEEPGDAQRPLPFAAHSAGAITVGSAAKSHWGGLRIGWIRAPHNQIGRLNTARLSLDLGAAVLEQLVLARLLTQIAPQAAAVGPHRRSQLREQRDSLLAALARDLPDWRVNRPTGGLSLWCRLPSPRSTAVVAAAERHGLLLVAGSAFAVDGHGLEGHLRLPFTLPPHDLQAAAHRLAEAWQRAGAERPGRMAGRPLIA